MSLSLGYSMGSQDGLGRGWNIELRFPMGHSINHLRKEVVLC